MDDLTSKAAVRRLALTRRGQLVDLARRSSRVIERLRRLPEYRRSRTVMHYVSVRDEVMTHGEIRRALRRQQVIVPYCCQSELALFRLREWRELTRGAFRILEPERSLRGLADRGFHASELEVVIVPGVAFSPSGQRLGHGHGYYDRLLSRLGPGTTTVGLAFDCQVFDQIPTQPHDMGVQIVVTETRVLRP